MALESALYGILNGYMASESALINTMLLGSVFGSVRFVPRGRFSVRFKPKNRARKNFTNRFQTRRKFDPVSLSLHEGPRDGVGLSPLLPHL